jgi:hypothetical protein
VRNTDAAEVISTSKMSVGFEKRILRNFSWELSVIGEYFIISFFTWGKHRG